MELQLFSDMSSEYEDSRTNATNAILEAMKDPGYLNFLLNLLDQIKTEQNHIIVTNVLYVIYKMLGTHKYSYESLQLLSDHLFDLLLEINYEQIRFLNRCLSKIFIPHPLLVNRYLPIVINEIIKHETIEKTVISLCFASTFIEYSNKKDFNLEAYSNTLIPQFVEIMNNIFTETGDGPLSFVFIDMIDYIFSILSILLEKVDSACLNECTLQLIQIVPQLLASPDLREQMIQLRKHLLTVYEYSKGIVHILINNYGNPDQVSSTKREFSAFIKEDYSISIINSLIQLYEQASDNSDIVTSIIPIFKTMINRGIHLEILISEEFITKFIYNVSKLTQEDVALMEQNPLQYYYFCVNIKEKSGDKITRGCIYYLLKAMYNEQPRIIDYIIEHFAEGCEDESILESKLFLLSICSQFVKFDESVVDPIIKSIDYSNNIYIRLQFLNFLSRIAENSSVGSIETHSFIIDLSCQVILTDPSELGRFAGCLLLLASHDDKSFNVAQHYDVMEIIQTSLTLLETFNHKKLQQVISLVATSYPNNVIDSSVDLISTMMKLWEEYASQMTEESDPSSNGSELLVSVAAIIDSLPIDTFKNESENIIDFILNSLLNYRNSMSEMQLCCILTSLKNKLTEVPMTIYNIFDVLNQITENEEGQYDLIEKSLGLIICLIKDFNNFVASEKMQVFIEFIDNVIQQTDLGLFLASIPFVLAFLVQKMEQNSSVFEIVQRSFMFLNDDTEISVFSTSVMLLASGILINEDEICQNVNDEVIEAILRRLRNISKCDNRTIKYTVIVLTSLGKQRNSEELINSAMFLLDKKNNKAYIESSSDEYEEDICLFDEGDIDEHAIPDYELPFDSLNATAYYNAKIGSQTN
ncbi:hypothetical protein TVAG_321710 [Trichomonas vaginalis G3]|uniref:Importin N-terminal domain-containing protein n=1 Tax=Trichomonas vaginalis (strain ATCC PRA-98 / G3) TaxID=412133 RepID=A2FQE9_TRIV3|nr:armadillo (ARM) repeat-containing protein family [Trichomonas vaginalis G3]EAX92857.1 hypothetical protein TVAG_321710 [Trichomonas vaginalis G3]KAI5515790.1 armadillo (ARM) repeat-containing protein family [Trichomonas vaginalis G3]|eukprot:XP_001305787.1 hypothetical protein [Trichomonas vaginalis G3]